MHFPNPFVKPILITRHTYPTGGGGTDPDPDIELVNKVAANSGKIYLLITDIPSSPLTDSIQNRMWLPEIQKIILSKHPNQRNMIFGGRTMDPLRVIVYE
jgi:hypothetical protein